MRSEQMTKRYYHDATDDKYVTVYYLMHNIPEAYDDSSLTECYSVVAWYCDGDIRQWFYSADDLKSAFRVFRMLCIDRRM